MKKVTIVVGGNHFHTFLTCSVALPSTARTAANIAKSSNNGTRRANFTETTSGGELIRSGANISIANNKNNYKLLLRLLRNYDARVRPRDGNASTFGIQNNSGNDPVRVVVNVLLRMLSKIDVVNMEYFMQITFREQWSDRRLSYAKMLDGNNNTQYLTMPYVKEQIWLPDTFFPTEKLSYRHMVDTENMFLRIYPNGTIYYSARLSMTCSCHMKLGMYPLDVQFCDFDLISYAFTTKDIIYEWSTVRPIQIKEGVGLDLPNFRLDEIDTTRSCTSVTNTGTYSCLRMRMKLSRKLPYFIFQLYIPTTMIVIVSWISFWIDIHSTAGRVALAMTTLLTITTTQSNINAKLPPVNYIKVIDVWLEACQTFVFGALIEYAFVCYLDQKHRLAQGKRFAANLRESQRRRIYAAQRRTEHLDHCPQRGLLRGDDRCWTDAPCICELGGLGSALLASLGFLPDIGSLTTLLPLITANATGEADTDNKVCPRLLKRSAGRQFGRGGHRPWSPLASYCSLMAFIRHKLKKPTYIPAQIDYYARIFAPIGFFVFNIIYWGVSLFLTRLDSLSEGPPSCQVLEEVKSERDLISFSQFWILTHWQRAHKKCAN